MFVILVLWERLSALNKPRWSKIIWIPLIVDALVSLSFIGYVLPETVATF